MLFLGCNCPTNFALKRNKFCYYCYFAITFAPNRNAFLWSPGTPAGIPCTLNILVVES